MHRYISHRFLAGWVAGLLAMAGSSGVARAQHGDYWLHTDAVHNKVDVGDVNEAGTVFTPGVRVEDEIMTPDTLPFSSFDYSGDDPGFRAAAGELPPSQPVSLTLQSLSIWNGSGLDPAVGVSFGFDLSGGFGTEPSGAMHEHPLRGLTSLTASPVPDGVYVAALRAGTAGLGDSNPFYLVMLKDGLVGDETDANSLGGLLEDFENGGPAPVFGGKNFTFFEDASAFVTRSIPEPGGVLLVVCAALGLARVRRGR